MDVEQAIRGRRSIRKFTGDRVTEETIREILESARWAPSWANTQPWNLFAVTGETLEQIRAAYSQRACAKVERRFEIARPRPDWPPPLAARTRQLMDARALSNGSSAVTPTSADFFGAPCLLLLAIDERLQPEYACFDTGLLVQSICLAAHGRGLGTCIMAMAVGYPDVLHELLPQAAGKRFVVGIALGIPDPDSPVNRFDRSRAALDEVVTFAR